MRRAALLLPLLVGAAACRTLPPDLTPLPPDDARPPALLAALAEQVAQRRALRGTARLAVDASGRPGLRGSQRLVLERPDRLRVEILGFLSQTAAVLVTDAGHYEFFVPGDRSYDSGELYRGLLWQVAGIDLEPSEVVDLVLGAPAQDPALGVVRAFGASDGGVSLELDAASGGDARRLVFDAQGRLRRLRVSQDGEELWTAEYDDYESVGDVAFAHAILLRFPRTETRAELSLRDVELNPELPEGLFRLRQQVTHKGDGGAP